MFLPYTGMVPIFIQDRDHLYKLSLKKIGTGVSGEKSFNGVDGNTDGRRTGSDHNSSY